MKNLVILFLLVITISPIAYSNEFRKVTCDISFDTDYAPISIFNGFKRTNYDILDRVEVNVPISSNPESQTLVYESPELFDFFRKDIKFTANITIDPNTKKEKLFIGMYEVMNSDMLKTRFRMGSFLDSLDHLMFFSKMSQVKNYDGSFTDKEDLYLPIGSSVSDSGFTEIFNGKYGEGFDHRFKMSCKLNSNQATTSAFDPESRPREKFTCNIKAKQLNSNHEIDEINKKVTLGFLYSEKRDLQPIIEDDHFDGFLNGSRIMGNLYIDSQTQKPMFLLGIYQAFSIRAYNELKHEEYKPNEQLEAGVAYYMPIAESASESDYIEVRTMKGFTNLSSIKVECKKITNQTVWLESLVLN